ncbi:MAG: hypothetical protein WBA12_00220 [Catalinimonas sp.]
MKAFVRVGWFLSILGFVVALFGTYKDLTDVVAISFDGGTRGLQINRDVYFYGAVALLLVGNVLFFVLARVLPSVPKQLFRIPAAGYWHRDMLHRRALDRILTGWIYGLAAVYNFFIIVAMTMVESGNQVEGDRTRYDGLLLIGFALLIITLITLPIRLRRQRMSLVSADER